MNEYKDGTQLGCKHPFLPPRTPTLRLVKSSPILDILITMPSSVLDPEDLSTLEYIVTHVFCPLQLPNSDDQSVRNDCSLAGAIATAARLHTVHISDSNIPLWDSISRMLDNLRAIVQHQDLDGSLAVSQLHNMNVGGKSFGFHRIPETHAV